MEEGSLSPSQLQSLSKSLHPLPSPRSTYEHLRPGRKGVPISSTFAPLPRSSSCDVPDKPCSLATPYFGLHSAFGVWVAVPACCLDPGWPHSLPDSHPEMVPSGMVAFLTPSLWAPWQIVPVLTRADLELTLGSLPLCSLLGGDSVIFLEFIPRLNMSAPLRGCDLPCRLSGNSCFFEAGWVPLTHLTGGWPRLPPVCPVEWGVMGLQPWQHLAFREDIPSKDTSVQPGTGQ